MIARLSLTLVVLLALTALFSASPTAAQSPPSAPGFAFAAAGNGTLTVSWMPVLGATKYEVAYSSDNGGGWTSHSSNLSGSSVTISGLDYTQVYVARVRAGNANSWSGWKVTNSAGPWKIERVVTRPIDEASKEKLRGVQEAAKKTQPGLGHGQTSAPSISFSDVAAQSATLNLANHHAAWSYKQGSGNCSSAQSASTSSVRLTGLTGGTTYTYEVWGNGTCAGGPIARATFTTSPPPHVTNLNNASSGGSPISSSMQQAVDFRTGPWSSGYTLTSVTIPLRVSSSGTNTLAITLHAAESNNKPADSSLATLSGTAPTSSTFTNTVWTCSGSGCDLASGTKYFIVATLSGGGQYGWSWAGHTQESTTPSDSGWSIGAGHRKSSGSEWTSFNDDNLVRIDFGYATSSQSVGSGITAADVTATAATLSVPNHTGSWYYSISGGSGSGSGGAAAASGPNCVGPINGPANLTQLNADTTYTIVAWVGGCGGEAIATGEFVTAQSGTLSLERLHATSAVLDVTLQSTSLWYYQADSGPHSTACSGPLNVHNDAHVGGLTPLTEYTYKAYTDANCTNEAASVTFTTLRVDLVVSNLIAESVTLTPDPAHWPSATGYWLKGTTLAGCEPYTGSASAIRLWPRSQFTFEMHSTSSCNDSPHLGYAEIIGPYAPLTATHVSANSATLELGGWTQRDWWYQRSEPSGDSTCHKQNAGDTTVTLTGLQPNTQYSYWAYWTSDCAAQNSLRSTASPGITFSTVSMAASEPGATTATITLSGGQHGQPWWYAETAMNPSKPSGQPLSGNCHTGGVARSGGSSVVVRGLVPGNGNSSKPYTFTAYSDADCSVARAMGSVNADTLSPRLSTNKLSGGGARLTLGNWGANDPDWHYRVNVVVPGSRKIVLHGADGCTAAASGALQVDIDSLPPLSGNGAYYIFTAYSASGCHYSKVTAWATLGGPPATPALSTSAVTQTGATLTIAGHPGTWYYKATSGPDATCQGPVQAVSATLTGLSVGTTYNYTAYSNSGCTAQLAAAPAFTTLSAPGAPSSLGAQYQDGSLKVWWSKPSSAQSSDSIAYSVECSTDSGTSYTSCASVAATSDANVSVTASATGVNKVRVRASQGGASGVWAESNVPSGTVPGAPTNVGSSNQIHLGGITTTLTWSKPSSPSGAVGYEVQCSTNNGASWYSCKTIAATTSSSLSTTIDTTFQNTLTNARVRSVVDGLVSAWATAN